MADVRDNPPEALRRQGLRRAVDNVGAGQQLQIPASKLWVYFGAELRARFIRPRPVKAGGPVDE